MSSIKTTQIDGDVSVGRNLSVGGRAEVAGSAHIGHNLKVDGWLDAKNIKGPNKGIFTTITKLREMYPNPHDGWWALVGTSLPAELWLADGGEWVDQHTIAGNPTIDSEQYNEGIQEVRGDIAALQGDVNNLEGDIERLDTRIDGVETRIGSDERLISLVSDKANANESNINALTTRVGTAENRINGQETALQGLRNSKGLPNGIAPLNELGKVPAAHLPGYVDDVVEFSNVLTDSITIQTSEINKQSTDEDCAVFFDPESNKFVLGVLQQLSEFPTAPTQHTPTPLAEQPTLPNKITIGGVETNLTKAEFVLAKKSEILAATSVKSVNDAYRDIFTVGSENQFTADDLQQFSAVYTRLFLYYDRWADRELYADNSLVPHTGKLFIAQASNVPYRWDGSDLVEIGRDISLLKSTVNSLDSQARGTMYLNLNSYYDTDEPLYDVINATRGLSNDFHVPGIVVTFIEDEDGTWKSYQWKGSIWAPELTWDNPDAWEEYGNGGGAAIGNAYNVTIQRIANNELRKVDGGTTQYDADITTAAEYAFSKGVAVLGMQLTFALAAGSWKNYQYVGSTVDDPDVFKDDSNWIDLAGLSAGTEAMVNMNVLVPDGGLNSRGFYVLDTALQALKDYENATGIPYRKKNLVITYRTADGESETKQYKGDSLTDDDFYSSSAWEDFGKGSLEGIKVNGEAVTPGADGTVNIVIPEVEVDETLDETSTRPVQNATIAAELRDRKAVNVTGLDILGDADNGYKIKIFNADGEELDSVNLPVSTGGGGGGEQTEGTKIVLNAEITDELGTPVETIREGSPAMLRFVFGHQYSTGDNTGQETGATGDLTITVKNGITVTHEVKYPGFGAGSGELDITNYLRTGNNSVTVFAVVDDPVTGTERRKQVTPTVTVRRLSLTSSYDMQNSIRGGGYRPDGSAVIPFNCVASGKKDIHVIIDGVRNSDLSITGYSATSGEIRIPMNGLALGRHNVQIYATQTLPDLELQSETIFIDLLKQAAEGTPDAPFIGTKMVLAPGAVLLGSDWQSPTISARQYAQLTFGFVAYDPDNIPATVGVKHNGVQTQTISATRQQITYTNRFTDYGRDEMQMVCGDTTYDIHIDVLESSIDISEVKDSVWFSMNAAGRSNSEQNPGQWTSGDVTTSFDYFDWLEDGSGWNNETLKLMNGAKATINVPLLRQNATTTGMTFECELRCTNIVDRTAPVIDCMDDNGVGFRITAEEARATMDGGESVSTKYASGEWIRVVFTVEKSTAERRLLSLYVNGVHDRVCRFDTTSAMLNGVPGIQILSDAADVELRMVRAYNRCLTSDEIFQNYCAGRVDTEEMIMIFDRNDVLDADLSDIDIEKMRQKSKGVLRIIGNESDRLSDLVYRNDKSFQMRVTLEYISPWGKEYDFRAENALIQIQGTSSVTYPRKNWDILFDSSTRLYINGILSVDNKYSFKPGARPVSIFCLKADYCDSSSTHNTGACKTINDVFKRCGWLTPPQQWAQDHSNPYDVRTGIDSFPITLYNDNEGAGEAAFIGKYNFNNEKKGSGIVYGFEGIEGFNDAETLGDNPNPCICLEFLENGQPLNLFQNADMTTIVDPAKNTKAFDKALEFRFPTKTDGSKIKWGDATTAQKNAINRLWQWIVACKNDPSKFRAEYTNYFGNDAPFAQYVFSDYFMAVDDRAKNMMLATWDGLIWYFIPYDWDCLFGVDNTSHLKYNYDIDEDSFDSQLNNYAFAGHDSELWKLVRACPDKLAEVAAKIRANMSVTAVKAAFSTEYKDAWCERVYNADEKYKYIDPAFVELDQQSGEPYGDYLFALQGTRESHRNYIIDNRFALLDSLYGIGDFRGNFQKVYLYGDFSGANSRDIVITAFEKFGFAYGSNNAEPSGKTIAGGKGDAVTLTINSNLSANDPQNIYGADRIEGLDMSGIADCLVSSLVLSGCKRLRDLDLTNNGNESLEQLDVTGNRILRSLKVNGLNNIRALDLSKNRKLETLEADDTNVQVVNFATGAVTTSAKLPASIQSLTMTAMPNLTLGEDGLSAVSWENMTTLQVDQMGALNPVALLKAILLAQDEEHRNLARVKIGGTATRGDGSELLTLLDRGVVGVTNAEKPEVNGEYQLDTIIESADIERIEEGIAGIRLLIIIEAYIKTINEVNAELYGGMEEVENITVDNIDELALRYYNGETYEEWLERFAQDNANINSLIN